MQEPLFETQNNQNQQPQAVNVQRLVSKIELLHGDCLEVMKDIPSGSVDMVLTDPPYGTTACKWDSIIPLEPMWEQLKRIIKQNGAIALMAQTPFDKVLGVSNLKMLRYEWLWVKEQGTGNLNANKMPLKKHENILVFYSKLPTYNPQFTDGRAYQITRAYNNNEIFGKTGTKDGYVTKNSGRRYPTSLIECNRELRNREHPTQKPVALMEYLIKTYTHEGETVLDFTMGSGTTGVACKNLGRNFIGIELDETYYQIANKRIEAC